MLIVRLRPNVVCPYNGQKGRPMNTKKKRIIGMLLALALAFGLLPMASVSAAAATQTDVAAIPDLKTALESAAAGEVRLAANIVTGNNKYVIEVNGVKTLDLNGFDIEGSSRGGVTFTVSAGAELTVKGKGSVYQECGTMIFNVCGGSLNIQDGKYLRTDLSNGPVLYVQGGEAGNGGKVSISGGWFERRASDAVIYTTAELTEQPPQMEIKGGTFIAEGSGVNVWAAASTDRTLATISGGTFYSRSGAAFNLENNGARKKLATGYFMLVNGSKVSATGFGSDIIGANQFVQVAYSSRDCAQITMKGSTGSHPSFDFNLSQNFATVLNFSVVPVVNKLDAGYVHDKWSCENANIEDVSAERTYVTPLSSYASIILSATAKTSPKYNIFLGNYPNGNLTIDPASPVYPGVTVTVTADTNDYYGIKSIIAEDKEGKIIKLEKGNLSNVYTFVMPASDVTIHAEFARQYYIMQATWIKHGKVSTSVQKAHAGEEVQISCVPDENYVLDEYVVTKIGGGSIPVSADGRFIMPDGDIEVAANFKPADGVEIREKYTLNFVTNGGSAIESVEAEEKTVLDLSTFKTTRENFMFDGWYADAAFGARLRKLEIKEDSWVYAKWIDITNFELPFTDVSELNYFYEPVKWAVIKDITSGTSATTFSPDEVCTRAQVATFLWKAAGSPEPEATENPFSDVNEGSYYYKAVLWAVEADITSGTGSGKFSPDAPCTRAQVVTFLWKASEKPEPAEGAASFRDVSDDAYYAKPVAWAYTNGISSGTGDGKFSPDAACTRAQIVTFLYKAFGK